MINIVDKDVEELEAQLLERLRRDEANGGFEVLRVFGKD